jgi:uncharacterized protein (DUF1697 family)
MGFMCYTTAMKYAALLRGINVGGNNMIKMTELKASFERSGYTNVITYINSGNVIFESDEKDRKKLTESIESMLSKAFGYKARVHVITHQQVADVAKNVPDEWNKRTDIRCYVAFVMEPMTAEDAAKEVSTREGVDTLKIGPGVLYMTSLLSQLTKSHFNKLAGKPIYKEMTIRNYNTTKKLLALMEQ